MNIVIYYHNDSDGRMSAAIVARHLRERLGDKHKATIHLEEVSYGMRPNRFTCRSAEVWVVDFAFSKEDMLDIAHIAERLIWIDHHKSSIVYVDELKAVLEPKKKGAIMHLQTSAACLQTWHYCFPKKETPMSVAYVNDRDCWSWKLKGTAEFEESLQNYRRLLPSDPKWQEILMPEKSLRTAALVSQGANLVTAKKLRVEDRVNEAQVIDWEGHSTAFINSTSDQSEVGHESLNGLGIEVAAVFRIVGNMAIVSLRSEKVDVSVIAQEYKGGGHKCAAGFVIRADVLLGWLE